MVRTVQRWKWIGLGVIAAVAVAGATAVVVRQRRTWVDADDAELAERLKRRLADLRAA